MACSCTVAKVDQCQNICSRPAPAKSNFHWQCFMPSSSATKLLKDGDGIPRHHLTVGWSSLDGLSCFALVAIARTSYDVSVSAFYNTYIHTHQYTQVQALPITNLDTATVLNT